MGSANLWVSPFHPSETLVAPPHQPLGWTDLYEQSFFMNYHSRSKNDIVTAGSILRPRRKREGRPVSDRQERCMKDGFSPHRASYLKLRHVDDQSTSKLTSKNPNGLGSIYMQRLQEALHSAGKGKPLCSKRPSNKFVSQATPYFFCVAHRAETLDLMQVLDFLLEADGLDDTLIKHFHDVNANQFEELPPNTQARLMLRVLRDAPAQPTGIAEAALGALNMLKSLAEQMPENFAPGANLEALKPSPQLFTEVLSSTQ